MQNRCKIITEAAPIFTVSLHQNSYPSPEVCGAQVFYFGQSQDGKKAGRYDPGQPDRKC